MENCTKINFNNSSLCNATDLSHMHGVTDSKEFKILFASILGVILIISVVGNTFTCYVIATRRLMKKTVWFYLFILSVSDGAMSVTGIPTILLASYNEQFLSIPWVCRFNLISMIFFGTFTIYTIAAVNLYKLTHIAKPLSSLTNRGFCGFTFYFVTTLTIAFGLTLPPLFGFSGYIHFPGRKWCSLWSLKRMDHAIIMLSGLVLFGYVIPFIIILGTSVRTFIVFRRHNTKMKPIRRMSSDEMYAENRAILQTLLFVVTLFILLWTPITLYALFIVLKIHVPLIFIHIAYILMLSQGCVNPIIYYYKHMVFKAVFRKISSIKAYGLRKPSSLYDNVNMRKLTPSQRRSPSVSPSPQPTPSPFHIDKVPYDESGKAMGKKKKRSSERMHYDNPAFNMEPVFGTDSNDHDRNNKNGTLESRLSLNEVTLRGLK